MYDLPTSVDIAGNAYPIRSDYRAALDICAALSDPELTNEDKAEALLAIFYPDEIPAQHWQEAVDRCLWFISGGSDDEPEQRSPKLMDWQQDFPIIVAPINRVLGTEIRAIPYDRVTNTGGLHWWTFLSAYYEIGGDCLFGQVLSIRSKKAKGKRLEKYEQEWYRDNRALVDFKTNYTQAEQDLLELFTKG